MASAIATQVSSILPVLLLGALSVFVREEVVLTDAQLGATISSFFVASSISAIPGGRFADAIGPRRAMTLGMSVSVFGMVGVAAAMTRSWHLVGWMVLCGMGSGIGVAASNLALTRFVPLRRQGFAFGLKQASIPMGSLLAGFAVPALGLTIGWRWAFVIGPTVILAVFVGTARSVGVDRRSRRSGVATASAPLLPTLLLAATSGFAGAAVTATLGFFVPSGVDRGFSASTVGFLLAFGSGCGIAARVLWGVLADRRDRGHLAFLSTLLAVGSVGFALLGIVESVMLLVVATVVVFAAGWSWSGLLFMIATRSNPDAPAMATGIMSAGGGIGGLLGPLLFGWVVGVWSYSVAWWMTAAWMLVAAMCARLSLMAWMSVIEGRVVPEG